MTPEARERALRAEMRAENNIHPALTSPDGHYKVRVGGVCVCVCGCVYEVQHVSRARGVGG